MQVDKIFLAFLSAPTYGQARVAGLKELLRQMELNHYTITLAEGEILPEFEETMTQVREVLDKAQQEDQ